MGYSIISLCAPVACFDFHVVNSICGEEGVLEEDYGLLAS